MALVRFLKITTPLIMATGQIWIMAQLVNGLSP